MNSLELAELVKKVESLRGPLLSEALAEVQKNKAEILRGHASLRAALNDQTPPGLVELAQSSQKYNQNTDFILPQLNKENKGVLFGLVHRLDRISSTFVSGQAVNPVQLVGPPGIGKTTLVRTLAAHIASKAPQQIAFFHLNSKNLGSHPLCELNVESAFSRIAKRFEFGLLHPQTHAFLSQKNAEGLTFGKTLGALPDKELSELSRLLWNCDGLHEIPALHVGGDKASLEEGRRQWLKDPFLGRPEVNALGAALLRSEGDIGLLAFLDEFGHLAEENQQQIAAFVGAMGSDSALTGNPFPSSIPGSHLSARIKSLQLNPHRMLIVSQNDVESDSSNHNQIGMILSRIQSNTIFMPPKIELNSIKWLALQSLMANLRDSKNLPCVSHKDFMAHPETYRLCNLGAIIPPQQMENFVEDVFHFESYSRKNISTATGDKIPSIIGEQAFYAATQPQSFWGNALAARSFVQFFEKVSTFQISDALDLQESIEREAILSFVSPKAETNFDEIVVQNLLTGLMPEGSSFRKKCTLLANSIRVDNHTPTAAIQMPSIQINDFQRELIAQIIKGSHCVSLDNLNENEVLEYAGAFVKQHPDIVDSISKEGEDLSDPMHSFFHESECSPGTTLLCSISKQKLFRGKKDTLSLPPTMHSDIVDGLKTELNITLAKNLFESPDLLNKVSVTSHPDYIRIPLIDRTSRSAHINNLGFKEYFLSKSNLDGVKSLMGPSQDPALGVVANQKRYRHYVRNASVSGEIQKNLNLKSNLQHNYVLRGFQSDPNLRSLATRQFVSL